MKRNRQGNKALQQQTSTRSEAAWHCRTKDTLLFPTFAATVTDNISFLGTEPTLLRWDKESFLPQVTVSVFLK